MSKIKPLLFSFKSTREKNAYYTSRPLFSLLLPLLKYVRAILPACKKPFSLKNLLVVLQDSDNLSLSAASFLLKPTPPTFCTLAQFA